MSPQDSTSAQGAQLIAAATAAKPIVGSGAAVRPVATKAATQYICPMHAQITRDAPGVCPICGMALELKVATAEDEPNTELASMKHRLWWTAGPAAVVFPIAMSDVLPGMPVQAWLGAQVQAWLEFALATPVVLWGAWPFFVLAWQSLVNRHLNMFIVRACARACATRQ
ncbi:heavy metal-binding domain-containing protein [Roseateles sp.]